MREGLEQLRRVEAGIDPIGEAGGVRLASQHILVEFGDKAHVRRRLGVGAIAGVEFRGIGEGRVERRQGGRVGADLVHPIGESRLVGNAAEGGLVLSDYRVDDIERVGVLLDQRRQAGQGERARVQPRVVRRDLDRGAGLKLDVLKDGVDLGGVISH